MHKKSLTTCLQICFAVVWGADSGSVSRVESLRLTSHVLCITRVCIMHSQLTQLTTHSQLVGIFCSILDAKNNAKRYVLDAHFFPLFGNGSNSNFLLLLYYQV